MDELEKRRRQLADPDSHLDSLGDKPVEDLNESQLAELKENQAFENELSKAMNIDVPGEIADKIILNQRIKNRRNLLTTWAVAASLVTVSTISVLTFNQPQLPMAQQALNHVYHEVEYLVSDNIISAEEVKERLAQMNLSLPALPEKITYASKCGFAGDKAMHLIAEIDGQPVTLLITSLPVEDAIRFGDERFIGKMRTFASNSLIAIAENQELVDRLYQQIIDA